MAKKISVHPAFSQGKGLGPTLAIVTVFIFGGMGFESFVNGWSEMTCYSPFIVTLLGAVAVMEMGLKFWYPLFSCLAHGVFLVWFAFFGNPADMEKVGTGGLFYGLLIFLGGYLYLLVFTKKI